MFGLSQTYNKLNLQQIVHSYISENVHAYVDIYTYGANPIEGRAIFLRMARNIRRVTQSFGSRVTFENYRANSS